MFVQSLWEHYTLDSVSFASFIFIDEICGVIMGSLDAAIEGEALTREEYVKSGRSYIEKDTNEGKSKRHEIYDEFEQYKKWKKEKNQWDLNDIGEDIWTSNV